MRTPCDIQVGHRCIEGQYRERFISVRCARDLGDALGARGLTADVVSGAGVRAAAEFRGCDLWPILRRDLEEAALLQWPWSARAMARRSGWT